MATTKRATVYLEPELHRALRLKAADTDCSVSELVNDAIRSSLREDADDLAAIADRVSEPTRSFETFVAELRERGDL